MNHRRIAADGEPFDIDLLERDIYETEVEVIQYLRPDGKRRRIICPVSVDIQVKASEMILEVEDLRNGTVSIWVRGKSEPVSKQILGIAVNGPGENNPTNVLCRLVEEKFEQLKGVK